MHWRSRLSAHLTRSLRSTRDVRSLGFKLHLWVIHGSGRTGRAGADSRVGEQVEVEVARYFDEAVNLGKTWGLVRGAVLGVCIGVPIVFLAWLGLVILD